MPGEREPAPAGPWGVRRVGAEFLRIRGDTMALGLLAVLAPKCPLCFLAYCGALGTLSFAQVTWYGGISWAVLILVLAVMAVRSGRAVIRGEVVPSVLTVMGAASLMAGKLGGERAHGFIYPGVGLLLASLIWVGQAKPACRHGPKQPQA